MFVQTSDRQTFTLVKVRSIYKSLCCRYTHALAFRHTQIIQLPSERLGKAVIMRIAQIKNFGLVAKFAYINTNRLHLITWHLQSN